MFKRLKKLKKLNKSKLVREATEIDYDEDGNAIVDVGLKTANDFFSPYCHKTYEFINPEVAEYINMCESTIPIKDNLSIDIYTEEPTSNDEKTRIRKATKRFYAEKLVSVNKKLKRNLTEGLIFCFFGFIILFIESVLYAKLENMYLDTILAVVGWLFLWDGLEIWLDDRKELKRTKIRCIRIINSSVHIRKYSKTIQKKYKFGEFEESDIIDKKRKIIKNNINN